MPYTIRNDRPSVLHIPDASIRLAPAGTATVPALTPQLQGLLARQAISLVPHAPAPAPATTKTPAGKKGGRTAAAAVKEPADDAR